MGSTVNGSETTPPLLLRVTEAAELLGLHYVTVYRLIQAGKLPSVKIGGAIRVPYDALRAWLDRQLADQTKT